MHTVADFSPAESGRNWRVALTEVPGGIILVVVLTLVTLKRVMSGPVISTEQIMRSAVPLLVTVTV